MHTTDIIKLVIRISWPLVFATTLCLIGLYSCTNGTRNTHSTNIVSDYSYDLISPEIKDSLIALENSGLIHNFLTRVAALESEDNSTLEWILQNGKPQDYEELLYNHPSPGFKAVGIKGLVRNKNKAIYKHLRFSFDQDINIQYGFICQKLGGYFLYQLDFRQADTSNYYFDQKEFEALKTIIITKRFGCT